jgi:undecaprenyl-diphosphatase
MPAALEAIDSSLLIWLRSFHAPWLDAVMSVLTIIGIMAGIWQLFALLSLIPARSRAGAFRVLLACWLGLFVVDAVLKPALARVRPRVAADAATQFELARDAETRRLAPASDSYSFPSGHATSAFAGALTMGRVWPRARVVWWALAILISYSRIYLGHHYPLDVVGGALVGLGVGYWVLGGRAVSDGDRNHSAARFP